MLSRLNEDFEESWANFFYMGTKQITAGGAHSPECQSAC